MGLYKKAVLTNAGQVLIAQSIAEQRVITFTSVKTSSYAYPSDVNLATLVDLQNIIQEETPTAAEVFNDTIIQVRVRFDNLEISKAYLIETLGVYAKIGTDAPVLFSVIQAITPDQMPASSPVSPSALIYDVQTVVQQASQITVEINPIGVATVADIEELRKSKADIDHTHYIDLDEIDQAFLSVFTHVSLEEPVATAMSAEEIEKAINTPWNGESSSDPNALSAEEIEQAINTKWDGESSTDPNALTSEEISEAIANATT